MHSHPAMFCEVRVNSVTGEVRVSRFRGSLDCGRMRRAFEFMDQDKGVKLDLATIPGEDLTTYAMIRKADTLGVFHTVVHVRPDRCDIWVGTQVPSRVEDCAVRMTGISRDAVHIRNELMGGGFGRRLETCSIEQVLALAMQAPFPLQIVWPREEEIRQDFYRPSHHDRIRATLDQMAYLTHSGIALSAHRVRNVGHPRGSRMASTSIRPMAS